MTQFSDMLQADVTGALTEVGTFGTLRKLSAVTYSPSTGAASTTTTDYDILMAFFDSTRVDKGDQRQEGTQIQTSEREVLISTTSLVQPPTLNDLIIDENSVQWRITNVQRVAANGISVVYDLKVSGNAQ